MARELDLGAIIRLGSSEAGSGGRSRDAILADVCESLIGAVFLDGGYPARRNVRGKVWSERMRTPVRPLRDPKTTLQEWAQGRGLPTPTYREVGRSGPHHSPEFRIAVELPKLAPAEGSGRSKRAAEQAAAQALLQREGVTADRWQWLTTPRKQRAMRIRRADWRAQCRQIDAAEYARWLQGDDRLHKVQTTRALVRGIAVEGQRRSLFSLTRPASFAPKRRLDRAMVTSAWSGAHDADVVAVLIDARKGLDEEADAILTGLAKVRQPKLLLLNKIDLVEREKLLALAKAANDRVLFAATFMISALSGDGVSDAKRWLAEKMPPGPWLYPPDQMSDAPLRQLAAEITREKLFHRLHQELPYQSTVETESWKELRDGSVRIEQTIYVERESQRKIVLGKGGTSIKAIGAAARKEIAEIAEKPVHLFLFVKVREGWGDDPERYRGMGLEFPKE